MPSCTGNVDGQWPRAGNVRQTHPKDTPYILMPYPRDREPMWLPMDSEYVKQGNEKKLWMVITLD